MQRDISHQSDILPNLTYADIFFDAAEPHQSAFARTVTNVLLRAPPANPAPITIQQKRRALSVHQPQHHPAFLRASYQCRETASLGVKDRR